ncbi:MAG: peptidoglycan DD-metalloendopeptidase family protein [Pseudomonadota bacterium]
MGRLSTGALIALAAWALTGCADAYRWDKPTPNTYVVRPGDTLYNIAWRYGLDHRDIARWNSLGDGTLIQPGQQLKLAGSRASPRSAAPPRPVARPAAPQAPPPEWRWPLRGPVIAAFGADGGARTGVLIGAERGAAVHAAAAGRVVYAGSGLISFGQLLIVKHNETHLSAYGHNDTLLVAEGANVTAGQPIARVGLGPEQQPALHFEIRASGAPLDPLKLLPR